MAESKELGPFCRAAAKFWSGTARPAGDDVVLVELMSQDLRVAIRNLTLASALCRTNPARMVVLTGTSKDDDPRTALAEAYGAADVVDVHGLVDALMHDAKVAPFVVAGRTVDLGAPAEPIAGDILATFVDATAALAHKAPRLGAEERQGPRYQRIKERAQVYSRLYDALCAGLEPAALVTSSVDYTHTGLAAESARRAGVPVVQVLSTGTLQARALFPPAGDGTFRAELTHRLGAAFDEHVWPHRAELHRRADHTAWTNALGRGRPASWRGGGEVSLLEFRNPAEREAVRRHAMARYGFDPAKPVVTVYVPDLTGALHGTVEAFEEPATWLKEMAELALARTDVNWLFVDHPEQGAPDYFAEVAAKHPGPRYVRSMDLSKNVLFALTDLGLTTRGAIAAELPAYGIPALQAGWSEWSELGISTVAADENGYWRTLRDTLDALVAGKALLTDDQVAKARLWMWFHRVATDVPTMLVQHWELGDGDELLGTLKTTFQYAEPDADPLFEAVRRMWTRREPFLTRYDLAEGPEGIA